MKFPAIFLFLVLSTVQIIKGQNQEKIDSILMLISETQVDTTKARYYLELSNLTMYNDQESTWEYLEIAESILSGTNNLRIEASLHSQKANYYYRLGKIDSARHHLSNSVDKSMQVGDTLQAAIIRHNIGILDHYQGNIASANQIMDENIPVFEQYNDSLHLGNAFLMKGKIAISDGFFNIAMEESHNALKIHKQLGDAFRIAEDLIQIGIIYQTTGEDEEAIDIYNESIMYYKRIGHDQNVAQALNYMADSKIRIRDFQGAASDLEEALALSEKTGYTANIARVYYNQGALNYAMDNYLEARHNFETSLEIWRTIGSPNNDANTLYYLGRCYLRQNEFKKAIELFDESIALGKLLEDPEVLSKLYLEKSVALESLAQYKDALSLFKMNKSISDSIFTIQRTKATLELKTIYETEKKEQQLALQEQEIKVLEQQAAISSLQQLLLGIGLLLSIIGFYALNQKMKRNKLEKEKVEADLAFKKKELTTHALHLAKKNEVLENVKQKVKELHLSETKHGYQQLIRTINFDQQDDRNWENFTQYFEQVHKDFASNAKIRYPGLTKNELRFMALLKMNMSSKEIATILNISLDGIKKARQRLRKKMGLSPKDSLENTVLSI